MSMMSPGDFPRPPGLLTRLAPDMGSSAQRAHRIGQRLDDIRTG